MRWRKRGHVLRQHAFPPTPLRLDDELLRIFVAFCDARTVGRVGYVDVRLDRPSEIMRMSERPALDVGEPGCFDDNGVVPTCVLPVGDELWLYYTGYRLGGEEDPYTQLLGLAVSRDGGESFERVRDTPVLAPSDAERTTRGSAHVAATEAGFVMHYSGGSGWTEGLGRRLPLYNVRRLRSPDGIAWGPEGEVCLDFAVEGEHAIARPWPLRPAGGLHRMLFSYRTTAHDYRIGLAVSGDGETWERHDAEAGIDVSEEGWDSDAVAYGATVDHRGTTYLFYCGNGRGRTGFGYAVLEEG